MPYPSEGGTGLTAAQLSAIASIAPSLKSNLAAASAPTISDDSSKGYGAGSTWIYGGSTYTCTDATANAAVWSLPSDINYFPDWAALVAAINVTGSTYVGKYASISNANGGPSDVGTTYTAPAAIPSPIADGDGAVYKVLAQGVSSYSLKVQPRQPATLRVTSVQATLSPKPTTAGFYIFTTSPNDSMPVGINLNDIVQLTGTTWSTYQSWANAPTSIAVGTSATTIEMWQKSGSSWTQRKETTIPRTTDMITEFAAMNCASGAWDAKAITLGGMVFKWSQAAISGGYLMYLRSASSTGPSSQSGSQTVRKYTDSTVTGADSGNSDLWPPVTWTGCNASIVNSGPYQTMDYTIMSRGTILARWDIKAYHGGSNNLYISGTYYGPKYIP
jgi:hypothetical protein